MMVNFDWFHREFSFLPFFFFPLAFSFSLRSFSWYASCNNSLMMFLYSRYI
jgi:hypothetical protein